MYPRDPNAPRRPHNEFQPSGEMLPRRDPLLDAIVAEQNAAATDDPWGGLDPDAPDPADVEAIEQLNLAIRDTVDHFTNEEWPNLRDRSRLILEGWLLS